MCRHFQKYKSQHSKTLSHIEREESRHFFWPRKLYLHCCTIAGTHNKWTFSKAVRVAGMGLRTVAQSHKMVVGSWSTRHQTQLSSAEQSEHVGHSDAVGEDPLYSKGLSCEVPRWSAVNEQGVQICSDCKPLS